MSKLIIRKAAGESESFSASKLKNSMRLTGAAESLIDQVIGEVQRRIKHGDSTQAIYRLAFNVLKQHNKTFAVRYSLKRAIMNLGPQGFPFEQYLAALLRHYGYTTYTNQFFRGQCISHEIDVVAEKPAENIHAIIEAKFHSYPGAKTGAKDAMYTHARFLDINTAWVAKRKKGARPPQGELQSWLVTNTEVTSEAYTYAQCVGMKIISWDQPADGSLQDLIHARGLYPVTALLTLNVQQKQQLLRHQAVMCEELLHNRRMYKQLRLSARSVSLLEAELEPLIETEHAHSVTG